MAESLSLYELNGILREMIEDNLTSTYWVHAELSEVRTSQKGHCFLELVDKGEADDAIVAKARGVIMRNIYPLLRLNFEETTGQPFAAGIKVLLQVSVSFSEVYGYSLVIHDIDSSYTMGSIVRQRQAIWERLLHEGVAEMNRMLELPAVVQRIAVISSPTAAGYEDFCRQLDNNNHGFRFFHQLFPALMQGDEVEKSVIHALDEIAGEWESWDAVVIIRGGGAVSDLSCFDKYNLANSCAQFPLPVFTGIGHERDVCILDMVANRHFKTPTAVASFLLDRMMEQALRLNDLEASLREGVVNIVENQKTLFRQFVQRLDMISRTFIPSRKAGLEYIMERICSSTQHMLEIRSLRISSCENRFKSILEQGMDKENKHLQYLESILKAYDPQRILNMGYSITSKDGKTVRDVSLLKPGDVLVTQLKNGEVTSIVK